MSPADKRKYEEIHEANADSHGDVTFDSLDPRYSSLDVPDTDIRSAWNLVNPKSAPAIGKDASLAFLHILNNRHEGFRIPRTVPPSLRASFEKSNIDYQVGKQPKPAQKWGVTGDQETTTGRKAKFGETYLSRIGLGGGGSAYRTTGTDFSNETADWEEVRLKKQLDELNKKVELIEKRADERRTKNGVRDTRPALVKRELGQLLDYKRAQLRDLELGEGRAKDGSDLKSTRSEIDSIREQIEGVEKHWKTRQDALAELREQIDAEKRS